MVAGVLAMTGPALRLFREGPLASMGSVGGVRRARRIPAWPLFVGVAALVGAVIVLRVFEHGSLPLNAGINGMALGLCGVVLVTAWAAPRGAALATALLTAVRPAIGRPLGADVRRYALLFALSAALLTEGASGAIGSHSMQLLGTAQMAAQKADRLPTALLVASQSVLDQRDGWLSDVTFGMVADAAEGRSVSSRGDPRSPRAPCRASSPASRRAIGTAGRCTSRPMFLTRSGGDWRRGRHRAERDRCRPSGCFRGRHRRVANCGWAEAV